MKINIIGILAILYLLTACKKDEPTPQTITFGGTIQIVPNAKQLAVGDTFTIYAFYYDNNNVIQNVNFNWEISDTSLLSISSKQLITAKKQGIVTVKAKFENKESEFSSITIVGTANINTILGNNTNSTTPGTTINTTPGTNTTTTGTNNESVSGNNTGSDTTSTGTTMTTSGNNTTTTGTTNETVAGNNTEGNNTTPGTAMNTTTGTNTSTGNNTTTTGTSNKRTGSLSGKNGYSGQGTAGVELINAQLKVFFGINFSVQNGPDLVVYLSNAEVVQSSSLLIADLSQTAGSHAYDAPLGTNLSDYNYVIIHCRAVNRAFAIALLQ